MSSYFCETVNYIWNTQTDYLGEGSFGKVFRGINKQTGDKVAVKMFKHLHQEISREMEMLHTLKHEYIIQLITVEIEVISQMTVLIMELCNGGSLMQFLDEPENANGLNDKEFLLVVEHLTGGLEYLKKHDVIHRDVKPDNIMRHVQHDGQVIYKLADFGTARQLPEGQNFTSIHGTEPYLHPRLYKVNFFRDHKFSQKFDSNTDLWSIGVTMYHIATGFLPFRVGNRSAMLTVFNEITRNEGIIAAKQQGYSDQLLFEKNLPANSRLSFGLKELVTPIIAGLFIHDDYMKQWTFTKYSEEIKELVTRKLIHVVYINTMQILKIYIKPHEKFEKFQNYVQQQTGISFQNQGLFYKRKLIVRSVEDFSSEINDFFFLFDKTKSTIDAAVSTCPDLLNFRDNFLNTSLDMTYLSHACKELGICKQLVESQSIVYNKINNFIKDFQQYFKEELREQRKLYDYLLEKCASISDRVKISKKIEDILPFPREFSNSDQFEVVTKNFVPQASKLFDKIEEIRNNIEVDDISYDSYLMTIKKELTDVMDLKKNLFHFQYDRKYHTVEKIKIVHCVETIWNMLADKVVPQFNIFVKTVIEWYEKIFFSRLKSLQLLKKHLHEYRSNLKKFECDIQVQIDKNLELAKNSRRSRKSETVINGLQEYRAQNEDVELLLSENSELVNKMNYVLFGLSSEENCNEFVTQNLNI